MNFAPVLFSLYSIRNEDLPIYEYRPVKNHKQDNKDETVKKKIFHTHVQQNLVLPMVIPLVGFLEV